MGVMRGWVGVVTPRSLIFGITMDTLIVVFFRCLADDFFWVINRWGVGALFRKALKRG